MAFVSTGTTISFANGFCAEILDISGPTISRESIQTSHFGTSTAHTFVPATLIDNGEVTVELAFIPSTTPPATSVISSCVIAWSDSAGDSSWTFDAFVTGFDAKAPFEGRATATLKMKITGTIAIT